MSGSGVNTAPTAHGLGASSTPQMKVFSRIFSPTTNQRLNELIGFLLCVSALLLFLALSSYSPLDPSLNSASGLTESRAARNWVGLVGAISSDVMLLFFGIAEFLALGLLAAPGLGCVRPGKVHAPVGGGLRAWVTMWFLPGPDALLP